MRIAVTLSLYLVCLLQASPVWSAGTDDRGGTFAFVGRLISIEEMPNPCEARNRDTGRLDCISLDAHYRARYEVVQRVAGTYAGSEITFDIADHYGFPDFAKGTHALLFVAMSSGRPYLHKYHGFAVYRTVDREWASCGELFHRDDNEPPPKEVRALSFEEDFGSMTAYSRKQLRETFSPKNFSFEDGRIRCARGILLPDMYDIARTGAIKARGIHLPPAFVEDTPGDDALVMETVVAERYRFVLGGDAGYYTDWERYDLPWFDGLSTTVHIDEIYGKDPHQWSSMARINLWGDGQGESRPLVSFFFTADRKTRRITPEFRNGGTKADFNVDFASGQAIEFVLIPLPPDRLLLMINGEHHEVPCDFEIRHIQVVGSGIDVRFEPFMLLKRVQ